MKGDESMADETAEETFSKVAAEQHAQYTANRDRFEAQSWYDIDHRLALLLTPVFRMGDDATIELTVLVEGTIISGSVVSEQAWAQRQNDQIRIGSPAVADAIESLEPKTQDRYIHFLEPLLISGGVHVRLQATRVDLRKVSAWSIGRIPGE